MKKKHYEKPVESVKLTTYEMFMGKLTPNMYTKPGMYSFRHNKREIIVGINTVGGNPGGNLLALLDKKCGLD